MEMIVGRNSAIVCIYLVWSQRVDHLVWVSIEGDLERRICRVFCPGNNLLNGGGVESFAEDLLLFQYCCKERDLGICNGRLVENNMPGLCSGISRENE